MAKAKYRVLAGNQVLYRGSDDRVVAAVVAKAITITEEKLKAVGNYVYGEWVREVQTSNRIHKPLNSWRDVDYRKDYMNGLQRPTVFAGALTLQLTDPAALKVELGWAPPHGADEQDGLGRYDGDYHDLRPWLFSFGKIRQVKKGRRAGAYYRNLRFITPNMAKQLDALVEQAMVQVHLETQAAGLKLSEAEQAATMKRMRRAFARAYHGAIDQGKKTRKYSMWGAKLGNTVLADPGHVTSLYDRARPFLGKQGPGGPWFKHIERKRVKLHMMHEKTQFKTFRMIFKERRWNTNSESFFTRGIEPAGLISGRRAPVAMKLRQAIRNVIAGKNPDGSNGS
jgi:hypothetical protein